jgi:hypothetical protein
MHPRMAELIRYIDEQHERLRTVYNSVPPDRRGTRPSPGQWSATEVIAHLTLIERRLAGMFTMKLQAARDAGLQLESDESPVLPTIDLAAVLDRTTRISAPDPVQPERLPEPATWGEYESTRAQLKTAILSGDGLALGGIRHPHPVFGLIDLYSWIAFTGAHAARHAEQIREVGRLVAN